MRETAHSHLMVSDYVNRLRLAWGVLRLTPNIKSDGVSFECREVMCVIDHFEMIFWIMDYDA